MLQNMTLGSRVRVAHPEPTALKNQALQCRSCPEDRWELAHTWINLLHVHCCFQGWISEHGCVQPHSMLYAELWSILGVFVSEYFLLALAIENDTDIACCPTFRHRR